MKLYWPKLIPRAASSARRLRLWHFSHSHDDAVKVLRLVLKRSGNGNVDVMNRSLHLLRSQFTRVEFRGLVARNAQRLPLRRSKVLRQEDDLSDVIRVVHQVAIDRLHDRVRLAAYQDRLLEVVQRERLEGGEDAGPAAFPVIQHVVF